MTLGSLEKKPFGRWLWWLALVAFLCFIPLFAGTSWTSIATEILILGLAATALNVVFGPAGLVSFGHAAFYGLGAYTLILVLEMTPIPFWAAMLIAPIVAAIAALFVGWFCVRRIEIYFGLLTMAFGQLIWAIIHKWYDFTGGDRGIYTEGVPASILSIEHYYYFAFAIVVVCIIILRLIWYSPFGRSLQAIRENRERAGFIGINIRGYSLVGFVISAFFTGIAGALYAGFSHTAFPDYASFMKSGEFMFVCLLGGMHSFMGPMFGTLLYTAMHEILIRFTEYWPMVFGIIIIALVIFMRGGVLGFLEDKYRVLRTKREGAAV